MSTIANDTLIGQLNWRYATKQFDPSREISAEDWATLEETLRLSPSSTGLQAWKFLVIDDPEVRAKLRDVSYGQSQITDADRLVVLAAKPAPNEADLDAHLAHMAKVRGVAIEDLAGLKAMVIGGIFQAKDPQELRAWSFSQTYIAMGTLLTAAAMLEIDACPMEGFSRDEYDRILDLPSRGLAAVSVVTLGYRSAEDKYAAAPKVRFPREQVVAHV